MAGLSDGSEAYFLEMEQILRCPTSMKTQAQFGEKDAVMQRSFHGKDQDKQLQERM